MVTILGIKRSQKKNKHSKWKTNEKQCLPPPPSINNPPSCMYYSPIFSFLQEHLDPLLWFFKTPNPSINKWGGGLTLCRDTIIGIKWFIFNPVQDGGRQKGCSASFSPVTSPNVGISPPRFFTWSFNPLDPL